MIQEQQKYTPQQKNEIIAGIRTGIAKVKHHSRYTSLVGKAIQAALPGYTVYAGKDSIKIWGNGVNHGDNAVYLCWNWSQGKHWSECMEPAIQREDTRDYQERLADEKSLYPRFEEMNVKVTELLSQIDLIRGYAQEQIGLQPVPVAATLRKESHFWNNAQPETVERFPNLFRRGRA